VTCQRLLHVTLQRLPGGRIERAEIGGKVLLEEDPALAGLRAREQSGARPLEHRHRVHVEECRRLREVERAHREDPFAGLNKRKPSTLSIKG
jgi:hypothetical protein